MKLKLLITFLVANIVWSANAQNLILNGSFENNTATGNMTNLTTNWSNYVANSWQVDAGSMNLDSSFRCGEDHG